MSRAAGQLGRDGLDSRFWIGFLTGEPNEEEVLIGRLVVGRWREGFAAGIDIWSEADYVAQWRDGLERLAHHSSSVLVVEPCGFPNLYSLYREGERVFVMERLLIPDEDRANFVPADPYRAIQPRRTHNEDGEKLLTWECSYSAVEDFLRSGGPQLVRDRAQPPPE